MGSRVKDFLLQQARRKMGPSQSSEHGSPPCAIAWPPVVFSVTDLGHVRDATGNYYPRDIGRSSELSDGRIIFQFGDTFCHNLKKDYLGLSNNNCAIVQQACGMKAPVVTEYLTQDGEFNQKKRFNGEGRVSNLIDKRRDEADTAAARYKIWAFSGIVETHCLPGEINGWTFFEMYKDTLPGGPNMVYQYTGVAEVKSSNSLISARQSEVYGHGRELFKKDEPRIGSFCIIKEGDMLYAYGHRGGAAENKDIVLAQVPLGAANNTKSYRFWDGEKWALGIQTLAPVLRDMQHGQIFRTQMFGSESPFKYAFIGCNSWGDSTIQMGRASSPEGPWEVFPLKDVKTYALNDPAHAGPFRYCMYPHPWACDISKGDLMITWSEGGMTGGVLAVQIRLKTI